MASVRPKEQVAFLGERLRSHPEDLTETIDYYWTRFVEKSDPLRAQFRTRFVETDDRFVEDINDARLVVQTAASLPLEAPAVETFRAKLHQIELFTEWYEVSGWLGTMQAMRQLKTDDIASPLREPRARLSQGNQLFVDDLWASALGSRGQVLPERFTSLISQLWASQQQQRDALQERDIRLQRLQLVLYFLMLLDDAQHHLEAAFLLAFPLPAVNVKITRLYLALDTDKHFGREDALHSVPDLIELADASVLLVDPATFLRRLLQVKAKKHALRFLRLWSCYATAEPAGDAMTGLGADAPRPPMQLTDREIRVVLDVLLENALAQEALQLVRWCRNKNAQPGALTALFAVSASRLDGAPQFNAIMEFCRSSDRSWMDWLLKQHFSDEEQTELLQFLRRYKMVAEESLFCLHRNKLAEAKALLPETKGDFIPSLVQNFEMVQPAFLIGKQSAPATSADISMSEAPPADASVLTNSVLTKQKQQSDNFAEFISPIKPVVPSSPYTPSLFPPGRQARQPPRSDVAPKNLFPAIVPPDARALGLRTPTSSAAAPPDMLSTPLGTAKRVAPLVEAVQASPATPSTPTVSINHRTPASSRRRVAPRSSVVRGEQ